MWGQLSYYGDLPEGRMSWKSGFDPLQELKISLFSLAPRPALTLHKKKKRPKYKEGFSAPCSFGPYVSW